LIPTNLTKAIYPDTLFWKALMRLVLTLLLTLVSSLSIADTLTGRVVGVADGDTLTVLDSNRRQHKIRLAGIDAPEKAQAFGDRSKTRLSLLTFNKMVTVEWSKTDRYGRVVGKVMLGNLDINLEQIKSGMAWWYRDYAKEQSPADREDYEHHELMAKLSFPRNFVCQG
jgi:endonuclease YncB( thermonuclease family)